MNMVIKTIQRNLLNAALACEFRKNTSTSARAFFLKMIILPLMIFHLHSCKNNQEEKNITQSSEQLWWGPNKSLLPENDSLVKYGYALLSNTSYYLGPKGKVAQITNGMNCQNCHLYAGTVPWGNNYSGVAATYPKFRSRSGLIENIPKRINDCLERSLNGSTIDSNSKEMMAIIAYFKWVGKDVPKDYSPNGKGIMKLPLLNRPADSLKGSVVFKNKCQRCHGVAGQGQKNPEGYGYVYPPLWGKNSYTTAAGLYRLSKFAGFVKANMPFEEANYNQPILTDEQAWDVAAFVNSQPRPFREFKEDWPDISKKPYDHPFGPYADSFSEEQHKFGPFKPIEMAMNK